MSKKGQYSSVCLDEGITPSVNSLAPHHFSQQPISLFVVSGVRLVREGLVRSLQRRKELNVLGDSDFLDQSIENVVTAEPNVIVIDLVTPDGLTVAQFLRTRCPASKLVAFAVTETENDVFTCAAAGFCGYVSRDGCVDDLLGAVLDAQDGRLTCSPRIAAAMFDQLSRFLGKPAAGGQLSPLTRREREILALTERGLSNKEIARHLSISHSTVKNHIHNILQKLQVERRYAAAALYRSSSLSSIAAAPQERPCALNASHRS